MAEKPKLYASGLDFPEGPAFDKNGTLHVVNLKGGTVSQIASRKRVSKFVHTDGAPNGAQFHANGHLFVCDAKRQAILDIAPDGSIVEAVTECDGERLRGPNDLIFSDDGGYYFTDPAGSSLENQTGAVYRVDPDGTLHRCAQNLAFPNGVCLSPDGRRLYVAETHTRHIHEFALNASGMCAAGRLHSELPEGGEGPDGMAVDEEGMLYVAWYGMGKVVVLDKWGATVDEIALPGSRPTNVAFGGKEHRFLYITETETNSVYAVKNTTPGHRLYGER